MATQQELAAYRKVRQEHPILPASQALLWARSEVRVQASPVAEWATGNWPRYLGEGEAVRWSADGCDFAAWHEQDEGPDLSYLGTWERRWTMRGDRKPSEHAEQWFSPQQSEPVIRQDDNGCWTHTGMSRGVLGAMIRAQVMADQRRLEAYDNGDWCSVGVIVTCARAGVVLGRASLWGIESDAGTYFAEVVDELAREARDEADAILAKLCASTTAPAEAHP